MNEHRERADVGEEPAPRIEDGLRDVLMALRPFDTEETTRILLAVAALYDLPVVDLNLGGLGLDDDDTETAEVTE